MLQKSSLWKVASVFFDEPTANHYLKGVSRKADLAHTSTKNHLEELKKASLISEIVEKKGKRLFPIYKALRDGENFIKYKRVDNLFNIEICGLISYIKNNLMPKSIILFGSYARGEDIENSDIDIFVEAKKTDIELSKFEKKLKRKIELHFNENFKNYPNELKNNIINGIILNGYLEGY